MPKRLGDDATALPFCGDPLKDKTAGEQRLSHDSQRQPEPHLLHFLRWTAGIQLVFAPPRAQHEADGDEHDDADCGMDRAVERRRQAALLAPNMN